MSLYRTAKQVPLLVTQREAARLLSVSARTLFAMRMRGEIPFIQMGPRVLYSTSDLTTWITERRKGGSNNV